MKIGIDAHSLERQPTGVGRVLMNLLQQWNNFDLPPDLKFFLYFKKEIPELDLSDAFEKKLLDSNSNAFFAHYLLPRAAKKDKIDLLFCPAYIAPLFYSGKIALILHDIIYQARPDLYNWPSIWDRILLKWVSKVSARKAQIIFTPSEFSKREVIKHYQVNPEKIFVILEATDSNFKQITDQNKLAAVKRKYQIKDKFIFYVGSIFNRRHLAEVIEAFGRLASELTDYQFLVAGVNHTAPFIDIDGLVKEINQKLGRQAVLRQDYLEEYDLVPVYNAADLFIWLSDYEGFGLPVLEAMACGTPVVTSSSGSLPEVTGQAAIYLDDNSDREAIAYAIYQGLTNQELRQKLITKGLTRADNFSWQKCAQKSLDALLKTG